MKFGLFASGLLITVAVKAQLFYGLGAGVHFANKNTAIMYTGSNVAMMGLDYYLPVSNNNQNTPYQGNDIDDYFDYPYWITALPINPVYRPALFYNLYGGKELESGNSFYANLSMASLSFEQYFTVEVDRVNMQSPDPVYEQIPLFGKEKRILIDLGMNFPFYDDENLTGYFQTAVNLSNVRMEDNYFVLGTKKYTIVHRPIPQSSQKPGGMGYGVAFGLGFKYLLKDNLFVDFFYNSIYTKTTMNVDFAPFGLHHSLGVRFVYTKPD